MKNKTKLLCVVLMFTLLISILAACGGDTQPSATPSGTTPTAKPTPTDTTPSETTPGEDVGVKFPLVEETATLSVWRPWFNMLVTDANDLVCNQLIEQKTNVHIEWILAPVFSMAQDFGLMMSTGDYPDILQDYGLYAGGFDAAVNEGVYMDAADYLSLTPTFNAFREDDNIRKLTTTDSGVVYFGGIQSGEQPAWGGPMMRIDWLENLNLSTPKTYDDWYNTLVAFKEQLGVKNPLFLVTRSVDQGMGLIGGFGVNYTFFNQNGTVKFGPMEEGYREYLAMLADWYNKGLIYENWAGAVSGDDTAAVANGEVAATTFAAYTSREINRATSTDPNIKWEAVRFPSKDGSPTKFRMVNQIAGGAGKFITVAAVERGVDELAARWIDALYTEELAFIQNYGEEGVHWELGDDGIPHFTDEVLKNPEHTPSEMITLISDAFNTSYYMWIRENDMLEPETVDGCNRWMESGTGEWVMPYVTLTTEESATYSRYFNDIQTYVDEFSTQVINGLKELNDTTWNEYVNWLRSSGIEECIKVYQDGLDRYLSR